MRLPRVRFTVRTLMVLVAILACALVVLIPVGQRLMFLYDSPLSTIATMKSDDPPFLRPSITEGEPVRVDCPYSFLHIEGEPWGLPYRISIRVKLMDQQGPKVHDAHELSFYRVTGTSPAMHDYRRLRCALEPPGTGEYAVRVEIATTDLFGRTSTGARTSNLKVEPAGRATTPPGP